MKYSNPVEMIFRDYSFFSECLEDEPLFTVTVCGSPSELSLFSFMLHEHNFSYKFKYEEDIKNEI